MAKMYPSDLTFYKYTFSEKLFFEALREQLPDRVSVFFSVIWYQTVDGVRENSEADFVIFDPQQGFLCVELKGGKGIELKGEEWHLYEGSEEDGEEHKTVARILKRSPFVQVRKLE